MIEQDDSDYSNINIFEIVKQIGEKAPHFPDGSIDYTNEPEVVKFSAVIFVGDKILILKRKDDEKWEGVTGYIDRVGNLESMISSEIAEETGLASREVLTGQPFDFQSGNRTYIVQPCVVKANGEVKLNWEHTEWKLKKLEEIDEPLTEMFLLTIERMLKKK